MPLPVTPALSDSATSSLGPVQQLLTTLRRGLLPSPLSPEPASSVGSASWRWGVLAERLLVPGHPGLRFPAGRADGAAAAEYSNCRWGELRPKPGILIQELEVDSLAAWLLHLPSPLTISFLSPGLSVASPRGEPTALGCCLRQS
ncbi:hypothetical protein H8959_019898 [Pygathrix nigripes]